MTSSDPAPPTAERRWATIVFADLSGSTIFTDEEGDQVAFPIVTEFVRRLAALSIERGAESVRDLGDGVMAVFGGPSGSEGETRAAVNLAIEMRSTSQAFLESRSLAGRLGIHCGVHTGWVMAGELEVPHLGKTSVIGDTANVASRLCGVAQRGEIVVGLETWRATRDELEYRELPPAELKGKREPVRCFELLSTQPQPYRVRAHARAWSAAMIGRDAELARLRQQLAALAGGQGGVTCIVAEAGVGKSRLLSELARSPEASAVAWLEGRARAMGQRIPYHPFVDLIRSWAGVDAAGETPPRERLLAALRRWLGDEAPDVAPYLAALTQVPLDADEEALLAATTGEAREVATRRAVETTLACVTSKQPLVIVLDDCHWADDSSIALLESLLASERFFPCLLLLAFRPGYEHRTGPITRAVSARAGGAAVELRLAPLDRAQRGRLVDELLRGAAIPDPVRRQILDNTAGNPFFTEEVVRSLIDEGALRVAGERLVATERIARVVIPGTIKEVLLGRIGRLPKAARAVLDAAAVIGPSFDLPLLAEVAGKDRTEECVATLIEAGLLGETTRRAGPMGLAFHHPLVQQIAYEKQLAVQLREMHGRTATAIETLLTENAPGYHAMLAYHWALADDSERAEQSLFRAGEDAARAGASSEALHFFQQAAERYVKLHGAGGDPAKKAQLEKAVAMAWFNRGGLAEAVDHFTEALRHLGDRVAEPGPRMQIEFARDLAVTAIGLYLGAWRRRGRPPADAVQREIIEIRFQRGLAQTVEGLPTFAPDTMRTLRKLARVDPHSVPDAGAIYAGAGGIFSYGGVSFALGRRILDLSRELVASHSLRELELYYRLMVFIPHFLEGDWSEDHVVPPEVVEAGERYGRLWEVQTFWDLDADRLTHRGDWDAAMARLDQLDTFAQRWNHDVARGAFHYGTTRLHLERRDARAALDSALDYRTDLSEPSFQLVALSAIAKAHVLLGDLDAAAATLERADRIEAEAGLLAPFHRAHLAAARLAHTASALEAGARAGTRAPASLRPGLRNRVALRWLASRVAAFRPEMERYAGTIEWHAGKRRKAGRLWLRSLACATQLGAGPDRARAHWEIARHLAALPRPTELGGLDAAGHRDAALRLFEEYELEHELAQARASCRLSPADPSDSPR